MIKKEFQNNFFTNKIKAVISLVFRSAKYAPTPAKITEIMIARIDIVATVKEL
jgi:hypothetical protein